MTRLSLVGTIGAVALLAGCAEMNRPNDASSDAGQDLGALNECRTRAAISMNPAAGGGGLARSSAYDQALAQCLRNMRRAGQN